MLSAATTTITLYRGESTDEWGDPIDTDTVVETGIPAAITETNVDSSSEVSLVPREIRTAILRVGSEVDVQTNDRVYDEMNNESWIIQYITRQQNPVCAMDTKILLKRTT